MKPVSGKQQQFRKHSSIVENVSLWLSHFLMPDMATIFIRNQIKKTKNNVPFGNRGGSVGQSRADLGSWLFGRWLQYGVFCLNLKRVSMIPFSLNVSVLIQLGISIMRQPLAACRTVHSGSPETSYRWRSRQAYSPSGESSQEASSFLKETGYCTLLTLKDSCIVLKEPFEFVYKKSFQRLDTFRCDGTQNKHHHLPQHFKKTSTLGPWPKCQLQGGLRDSFTWDQHVGIA